MGRKKKTGPQPDNDQAGSGVSSQSGSLAVPSEVNHGKIVSSTLLQQPLSQPLPPHLQEVVVHTVMEIELRKLGIEEMKAVAEIEHQKLEDRLKEAATLAALVSAKHKADTESEDIRDRVWNRRLAIFGFFLVCAGAICFGLTVIPNAVEGAAFHANMRYLGGGLAFSGGIVSIPRIRKFIGLLAKGK